MNSFASTIAMFSLFSLIWIGWPLFAIARSNERIAIALERMRELAERGR